MHSSGSMIRIRSNSWMQSTGQTSTEFFFRSIFGVVNLSLGFLGLTVFFECTVHVNGPDLERALAKCGQWQRQHGGKGEREQFLHKTIGLIVLRGVRPPWLSSVQN